MTIEGHASAFSRHDVPEVCLDFRPRKGKRAQGRPGARCTRGLVCKIVRRNAHEHTGSAETLRPSPRNGFTAYIALSLATGFVATIARKKRASHELDASVGASEPHDFAVRKQRRSSLARHRVHRIPPYVRDDHDTPLLVRRDGQACSDDLPDGGRGNIFGRGAGQVLVICPTGQLVASKSGSSSLRAKRRNP
jgi:hypothetical protein